MAQNESHGLNIVSGPWHPLPSGGDGGDNGAMEARVAKLEATSEYIKRDVSQLVTDVRDLRDRMARIEERVAHLPGKGFIVTALIATLTITGAIVTIAPKLQAWFGVG